MWQKCYYQNNLYNFKTIGGGLHKNQAQQQLEKNKVFSCDL